MMNANNEKPRQSFYLGWVGLNFVAVVIAWYLAWLLFVPITNLVESTIQIGGQSNTPNDSIFLYLLFPLIGLLTGSFQYMLLRRHLPNMTSWIAATFLGWLTPFITGFFIITLLEKRNDTVSIMLGLFVIGATAVMPQWWMLRQRVHSASRWMLAHGLGWCAAGLLNFVTTEPFPVLLAIALLPAIATGIACWMLLDWLPKRKTEGDILKL